MKDVYEVLRQKELEVSRLQKEVDALRVAAPLLKDVESEDHDQPTGANSAAQQLIEDLKANETPQQGPRRGETEQNIGLADKHLIRARLHESVLSD